MTDERTIDLHCHSTFSDGTLTPTELAALAAKQELSAVALTDHDNFAGWEEFKAACLLQGVEPIEGVEISSIWEGAPERPKTVDILGYLFDPANPALAGKLAWMRRVRVDRNGMILEKLADLGILITREELAAEAGSEVIGRPHFAALMVRKGYCRTTKECFDLYLADNAKAWVPKARLSPVEAVELIRGAGGRPVIAHPYVLPLGTNEAAWRAFLEPLCAAGLAGLECLYSEHTHEQTLFYKRLALSLGLIPTGGSDFHGGNRPGVSLGRGHGALRVSYDVLDQLRAC